MKRIYFGRKGAWIVGLALIASCSKEKSRNMTVVRDCTGTYLRADGKDYQVCNISKTDAYPDGAIVLAAFKATGDCNETPEATCLMYHEHEGWVTVTGIE